MHRSWCQIASYWRCWYVSCSFHQQIAVAIWQDNIYFKKVVNGCHFFLLRKLSAWMFKRERLRNLEISSNWHIICSYIINDSTKVYTIRTIILRISCKCSNVPFSVIWSLHDHTLVFLRNHNGQNYWYK